MNPARASDKIRRAGTKGLCAIPEQAADRVALLLMSAPTAWLVCQLEAARKR